MSNIDKKGTRLDGQQVLKEVYNENDDSLAVSGFIDSKVGNKIEVAYPTSTREVYSYYDGTILIKQVQVIYTDSTKEVLSSVERIL